MNYIPLENKISLLNKYIQINILRNKGKALHVDIPENDIFSAIVEELKTHIEKPDEPKISLAPVIQSLKAYQDKQAEMRYQINALTQTLETIREEGTGQISLDEIIENLKELDKG